MVEHSSSNHQKQNICSHFKFQTIDYGVLKSAASFHDYAKVFQKKMIDNFKSQIWLVLKFNLAKSEIGLALSELCFVFRLWDIEYGEQIEGNVEHVIALQSLESDASFSVSGSKVRNTDCILEAVVNTTMPPMKLVAKNNKS